MIQKSKHLIKDLNKSVDKLHLKIFFFSEEDDAIEEAVAKGRGCPPLTNAVTVARPAHPGLALSVRPMATRLSPASPSPFESSARPPSASPRGSVRPLAGRGWDGRGVQMSHSGSGTCLCGKGTTGEDSKALGSRASPRVGPAGGSGRGEVRDGTRLEASAPARGRCPQGGTWHWGRLRLRLCAASFQHPGALGGRDTARGVGTAPARPWEGWRSPRPITRNVLSISEPRERSSVHSVPNAFFW